MKTVSRKVLRDLAENHPFPKWMDETGLVHVLAPLREKVLEVEARLGKATHAPLDEARPHHAMVTRMNQLKEPQVDAFEDAFPLLPDLPSSGEPEEKMSEKVRGKQLAAAFTNVHAARALQLRRPRAASESLRAWGVGQGGGHPRAAGRHRVRRAHADGGPAGE